MDTGFTIDDVRDTLTSDITRFLGKIESGAREILERKDLGVEALPAALTVFETIGDHGHAIYGTSRLVQAGSLADSAAGLEALAQRGRDELARAVVHLSRAREIAGAIVGGAGDMLAMLSLELDHRSQEASAIAAGWRQRVESVTGSIAALHGREASNGNGRPVGESTADLGPMLTIATARAVAKPAPAPPPPPTPPPSGAVVDDEWSFAGPASDEPVRVQRVVPPFVPDDRFSFGGSVDERVDSIETGAIDAELAEIFAEEARETMASLEQTLAALLASPDERTLLKTAERAYHTLKGAAATVGLIPVSDRAADLQARTEALHDAAEPLRADTIHQLIASTDELRRLAGLPSAAPAVAAAAAPSLAFDEVAAEFEREVRATLDEVEHLAGVLADGDPQAAPAAGTELRAVLHRLRGTALVARAPAIADVAAQMEACATQTPADLAGLRWRLATCATLLSEYTPAAVSSFLVASPPASEVRPSSRGSLDDAQVVFQAETGQILDEATRLLPELRAGDAPARARLGQLFHRLTGSALIATEAGLSTKARAVYAALESATTSTSDLADQIVALTKTVRADLLTGAAPSGAQRIAVGVVDPELEGSFQQECAELLELLDRTVLALERSERPTTQLDELLRAYHTLKGVVNALGVSPVGDQIHQIEDLLEGLGRATILPPLRTISGLLLPWHGELRRQLRTVRLGFVEVTPGRLKGRIARLLAGASRATSMSGVASRSGTRSGSRLGEGSEVSERGGVSLVPERRDIRVSIERLDALMNLAGELVIGRSRLQSRVEGLRTLQADVGRSSQRVIEVVEKFRENHEFSTLSRTPTGGAAATRGKSWSGFSDFELDRYEDVNILARSLTEGSTDLHELFGQLAGGLGELAQDSDSLGTIVAGIQGEVTRARMVPLDALFSRLQLPVRDAAQREGREARLVTVGDDVNLDKTIVDSLFQPMLHLVRNAVSHGIELPSVRAARGKPSHGTVSLHARQELGQIIVEITDDGAGLDLEALRDRGVAMGILPAETAPDDPRVRDLVFAHGLSTHATADAVAGRGVGCDVVRRAVERLNGSIRVESVRGERTTFVITLPLTLAISRALLVRHGTQTFAVPLYFAQRILDAEELEIVESAGQRRIEVDGIFHAIRSLGDLLSGAGASKGPVLLLQVGDQQMVLQVDAVVGQEEIVVKDLGALLRGHPTFAGVTIRGTGEIVLILDVPSLTESVQGERGPVRVLAERRFGPAAARAVPAVKTSPALGAAGPAAVAPGQIDRPLHVLFVDDSVSVRKVAERALRQLGIDVTLAVDGIDALDKLRAGQFDMVFTDLEMPRMHGYELIRELRFLPAYHALPVVVVTSRSGKKHRDEAHALGASEYLTKPFTARSLAAALIKFGGERARGIRYEDLGGREGAS